MTYSNNPAPRERPDAGVDMIQQLASALGQKREAVEKSLVSDRSALARDVLSNQTAMRVLSLREDSPASAVEQRLGTLVINAPQIVTKEKLKDIRKETFLEKIVYAPWRGAKRLVKEVVFHPVRTGLIVIAAMIGYKFLKDWLYHRAMSEGHLLASNAGRQNLWRDIDQTSRTFGGHHTAPPTSGRGGFSGGSTLRGGYDTGGGVTAGAER